MSSVTVREIEYDSMGQVVKETVTTTSTPEPAVQYPVSPTVVPHQLPPWLWNRVWCGPAS